MNDRPREILSQLIKRYGIELSEEPRRCEALLRDLCPSFGRETFALAQAAQAGVPRELRDAARHEPTETLINRLAKRLSQNLGLSYDVSLWAIESWALALQIASQADLRLFCRCPACGSSVIARKNLVGKRVKCPKCQSGFTVGDESSPQAVPSNSTNPPPQIPLSATAFSPVSANSTATAIASPGTEYFLWVDSQRVGPYSLNQLLAYPMPQGVLVWRQGLAGWTAGTDVPELAQHAAYSQSSAAIWSQPANTTPLSATFVPTVLESPMMPSAPTVLSTSNEGNDWPVVVSTHRSGMTAKNSRPHRGVLVLILGILSLVVCWPLGIVAVILGSQDLNAMQRGEMDRSGETLTRFGQILGIISLAIIALAILAAIGQGGG